MATRSMETRLKATKPAGARSRLSLVVPKRQVHLFPPCAGAGRSPGHFVPTGRRCARKLCVGAGSLTTCAPGLLTLVLRLPSPANHRRLRRGKIRLTCRTDLQRTRATRRQPVDRVPLILRSCEQRHFGAGRVCGQRGRRSGRSAAGLSRRHRSRRRLAPGVPPQPGQQGSQLRLGPGDGGPLVRIDLTEDHMLLVVDALDDAF